MKNRNGHAVSFGQAIQKHASLKEAKNMVRNGYQPLQAAANCAPASG
jgi:hypothetical protein